MLGEPAIAAVSIDRYFKESFAGEKVCVALVRIATLRVGPNRASQRVVFISDDIETAVPAADHFSRDIVQDPALASIHTPLAYVPVKDVILVLHDDSI